MGQKNRKKSHKNNKPKIKTIAEKTVAKEERKRQSEPEKQKKKKHPVLCVAVVVIAILLVVYIATSIKNGFSLWPLCTTPEFYDSYEDYVQNVDFEDADIKELRDDEFFHSMFEQIVVAGADDVKVKLATMKGQKVQPFLMYVKYSDDMIPQQEYEVTVASKQIVESSLAVQDSSSVQSVNGKEYLRITLSQLIAEHLKENGEDSMQYQVTADEQGIFAAVGDFSDEVIFDYKAAMQ